MLWVDLVTLIAPNVPEGKRVRPPLPLQSMPRVLFRQQGFNLSEPAMEEARHDVPLFREFANLGWDCRLPDEGTILRTCHLLESDKLADQILATVKDLLQAKGLMPNAGTVVDVALIAAPGSTKNVAGGRDPEMHQTKKGNQWCLGMKAPIGVDVQPGLVHAVGGTPVHVDDGVEGSSLLHDNAIVSFVDARLQSAGQRPDAKAGMIWQVAMKPGKRRALDAGASLGHSSEQIEKRKAIMPAKVEHPFRVIGRQFGHAKVGCRGLKKNTAQTTTSFALSSSWMGRGKQRVVDGQMRPKRALAG